MNVVDSSCWLEYFSGGAVGEQIAPVIEDLDNVIIPSIVLYEVFKKLLTETNEDKALFAVANMKQGKVISLDANLSIYAAKIGKEHHLPLADSIIYATTLQSGSKLHTQDKHFKGLPKVQFYEKE
jgi:predicted nucleic acid-binding protein